MVRAQLAGAYGTAADTRAADGARARRFSRLPQLALPALLAMALAGCAGGEGLDGAFGAQDTGVARTGTSSAGVVNSATTDALVVGTGPEALTYDCPPVTVRTGAGSWQVTAGGGLRYQGTLGRLARECSISGGTMMVRVGIEGRVLMGEKGTSGQVKVPIRIAVVQEGPSPKTITTKFFNVAVDVPADPGHAAFTVVEEQIAFPLLKPGEMERHVIYVGFDPQGSEVKERKPAPGAKPKPRPKPAADTSEAPAATPAKKPAATSGAPQGDVFGPPPGSSGTLTPAPSTGGFEAPPSTSTFSPPPR
ncbi:UNVERIFIED_ORG: hypothetical protein ABID33_002941 [Xanthobacter viscosus]|uniref:Lipoprotein n=1 Tax=Xanthobacter autotrophicus TaxID=280 RepID=A0A6C1KR73_XANAU|nr:hypothetical protein [Xanthobacter autotrophicus]TLX40923.1 hypothetical protein FBQ73_20955 [Xanthobacter autotrophicus]